MSTQKIVLRIKIAHKKVVEAFIIHRMWNMAFFVTFQLELRQMSTSSTFATKKRNIFFWTKVLSNTNLQFFPQTFHIFAKEKSRTLCVSFKLLKLQNAKQKLGEKIQLLQNTNVSYMNIVYSFIMSSSFPFLFFIFSKSTDLLLDIVSHR